MTSRTMTDRADIRYINTELIAHATNIEASDPVTAQLLLDASGEIDRLRGLVERAKSSLLSGTRKSQSEMVDYLDARVLCPAPFTAGTDC